MQGEGDQLVIKDFRPEDGHAASFYKRSLIMFYR